MRVYLPASETTGFCLRRSHLGTFVQQPDLAQRRKPSFLQEASSSQAGPWPGFLHALPGLGVGVGPGPGFGDAEAT